MSKLSQFSRPYVAFDPKNETHRKYFDTFINTNTWGTCPVRFVLQEDAGDLISTIHRQMVTYYMNLEFRSS